MRLPNAEKAEIAEHKIVRYLLSPTHAAGRSKAAFFGKHGFTPGAWRVLAEALRGHATGNDVVQATQTLYGMRYVIDGRLLAPDGSILNLRSVWFIRRRASVPTLVTAHPLRRESS